MIRRRFLNALLVDIRFQYRQGFYFVYIIISLIYIFIFSKTSARFSDLLVPYIVYLDPSILGLFFIGGILLLEKEQGILMLVYITPLRILEFVASKIISLTIVSSISVIIVSFFSFNGEINYINLIAATILTSILYTLFGFNIVTKSKSINDFFMRMIPIMIFMLIPCVISLFYPRLIFLSLIPSVASFKLLLSAYLDVSRLEQVVSSLSLIITNVIYFKYTTRKFATLMMIGD